MMRRRQVESGERAAVWALHRRDPSVTIGLVIGLRPFGRLCGAAACRRVQDRGGHRQRRRGGAARRGDRQQIADL